MKTKLNMYNLTIDISIILANAQDGDSYGTMYMHKANADRSRYSRGINVGLSLQLHTYFVYASSKVSGESAHMRSLA